ncbi:MAG: hypothetical protein DMG25_17850, partial [Acidobacteria bacterium]
PKNAEAPMKQLLGGLDYLFPHTFLDSNYLFDKDLNNVVPRVGLAWRATGKTVLRVGYGMYVDAGITNLFVNMGLAAPFYLTNNAVFDRAKAPTGQLGNEFGKVPTFSVQFDPTLSPDKGGFIQAKWAERDYVDGEIHSWNLNIQRLVSKTLSVQIGYIGNKTNHFPTGYALNRARPGPGNQQLNRPWPQLFSCDCYHSFGDGHYHSAQFELEQRFSKGLSYRAGYTFGRSINNFRWRQDEFDPKGAKALADWNRSQTFFFTGVYEIPLGSQLKGMAGGLIKGWQLSGIMGIQSGPPVGVSVGADIANIGSRRVLLPNRVADGSLPSDQRTLNRWFDSSAFPLPATYQYGNAGYNALLGPGLVNVDLALAKRWVFRDRQDMQFRTELFNVANHANFGKPNGTVDSGGVGRITSAGQARQIQFGLKYSF